MTNREVAALISRIPSTRLASALPHLRPFDAIASDVRREFAAWAGGSRAAFTSWQEAWNDWTGAQPQRPGWVRLTVICPQCHGRTLAVHRGIPDLCRRCYGRRRLHIREVALWQRPPGQKTCPPAAPGYDFTGPDERIAPWPLQIAGVTTK